MLVVRVVLEHAQEITAGGVGVARCCSVGGERARDVDVGGARLLAKRRAPSPRRRPPPGSRPRRRPRPRRAARRASSRRPSRSSREPGVRRRRGTRRTSTATCASSSRSSVCPVGRRSARRRTASRDRARSGACERHGEPVRELRRIVLRPERLHQDVARDRPAPARDQDLQQVARLLRLPRGERDGHAVAEDAEARRASGSTSRRRVLPAPAAARVGGEAARAERAQPLVALRRARSVVRLRGARARARRGLAERVADLAPDREQPPRAAPSSRPRVAAASACSSSDSASPARSRRVCAAAAASLRRCRGRRARSARASATRRPRAAPPTWPMPGPVRNGSRCELGSAAPARRRRAPARGPRAQGRGPGRRPPASRVARASS